MIGELGADLQVAERDLHAARLQEIAGYHQEGRWDAEKGEPIPVRATWHFWKGDDWTAEEKRSLLIAQTALTTGLTGGIVTLCTSALG